MPFKRRRNIKTFGPAPPPRRPMAELMMNFESLGMGCEFGVVQRCCGAEPLGLLRFTGSAIYNLVAVLENGLEDLLTSEDIGIEIQGSEREYIIYSRLYNDFHSHTNAYTFYHDKARIFAREVKKVGYLKRRFESDWRDATRIYVHAGWNDEPSISRLHEALRAKSDCTLLWVVEARSPEERGRVEILKSGLLKGFVGHHATFHEGGGQRLDLPGWGMVCRAADAIVRGLPEATPSEPTTIAAEYAWSRSSGGTLEAGPIKGRCRILGNVPQGAKVAKVRVAADFPAKTHFVFSVWIRLAASFHGRLMVLTTDDVMLIDHRRADLTQHETWQQIWLVARTIEPKQDLRFSFHVEAERGSEFDFSGWQVEEGGIPDESLRPSERVDDPAENEMKPLRSQRIRDWLASTLARAALRVQAPHAPAAPVEEMTAYGFLRAANELMVDGMFDHADSLLRAGMVLYPWQAELFTHYAVCAETRGHFAEAVERWKNVVDMFPQFALGHYRLAESTAKCGEVDHALAIIELALPSHSDDVGMIAAAARIYAAARQWRQAVVQWDQAIAMAGERPEWREARSVAEKAAATHSDASLHRAVFIG